MNGWYRDLNRGARDLNVTFNVLTLIAFLLNQAFGYEYVSLRSGRQPLTRIIPMLVLIRQGLNILGEMEIMRSVARSAGLVVLVHCSRGSRPRGFMLSRAPRPF